MCNVFMKKKEIKNNYLITKFSFSIECKLSKKILVSLEYQPCTIDLLVVSFLGVTWMVIYLTNTLLMLTEFKCYFLDAFFLKLYFL